MNSTASMKILIVEDDSDTRTLLRFSLKRLGLNDVQAAEDGNEGARLLRSNRFNLIICDWNMPNMNGLQLLQILRDLPLGKKTPFVMLTAENTMERVREALDLGVNDYIVKPWTLEILQRKLDKILQTNDE